MAGLSGAARRAKGQSAERELAKELSKRLDGEVKRQLGQERDGGHDIDGLPLRRFAIEVKRQEKLALPRWWEQACDQAADRRVPVVAYRRSRSPWRFVVPIGWVMGLKICAGAYCEMGIDEFCFLVNELR
jgi:hypothetical protein